MAAKVVHAGLKRGSEGTTSAAARAARLLDERASSERASAACRPSGSKRGKSQPPRPAPAGRIRFHLQVFLSALVDYIRENNWYNMVCIKPRWDAILYMRTGNPGVFNAGFFMPQSAFRSFQHTPLEPDFD